MKGKKKQDRGLIMLINLLLSFTYKIKSLQHEYIGRIEINHLIL
jgi:hypothetical protein